jgi:hypothetical protein
MNHPAISAAPRPPIVVTFANSEYLNVAKNWLFAIKKANVQAPIRIVALDRETRDALPAEHTLYQPFKAGSFASLNAFRFKILREMLEEENAIIHSDCDAVWLGNPLPLIDQCQSDMVFSQGTVWPPDVHAKHGIVLCTGHYYVRKTAHTLDLMSEVEKRIMIDGGDQAPLNRIIDERGCEWAVSNPYQIAFRDTFFTASREIIKSKDGQSISISILPHHLVARKIDVISPDMIVAHPLSDKTGEDKEKVLSSLGLWMI